MTSRPTNRRLRPAVAFYIGAATSGLAVAAFSRDWACAAIGAALIGGLAAVVANAYVSTTAARRGVAVAVTTGVSLTLAIGQAVYIGLALRHAAWVSMFGESTRRVTTFYDVRRYYAGGPGDRLTLIRFTADPADVERWIAAMPPGGEDPLAAFRAGYQRWGEFWGSFANEAMRYEPAGWGNAPTMSDARGHRFAGRPGEVRSGGTIVWDAATGDAFVVFTEG